MRAETRNTPTVSPVPRFPSWLRISSGVDYFRQQSFLMLAILMALVAWSWLAWSHQYERIDSSVALLLASTLMLTMWGIYRLYREHYVWAVLLFLVSHLAFTVLVLWWAADVAAGYLFLLNILMAGSLLGPLGAILMALTVWGIEWVWIVHSPLITVQTPGLWTLVVQQILVTLVAWRSSVGLHGALQSAEVSAAGARTHAEEARTHRAEVQKALKSLNLAHYQLERAHTELYHARRIADAALRFKREFAAQISHELRTSLNLILGFSETMAFSQHAYGARLPDAYLRDVTEIHRNSRHLLALIDDVLDLSKLETGRMGLHREPVDVSAVVREATDIVRPLIDAKGLDLTLDLSLSLPTLLLDRGRIRQILLNLLSNAAQVTESGGITVCVDVWEQELRVQVCDTGPGIPPDELERVFEEFHQLETRSGSAGLGLSVSKQIVHLHGGRMWAESEVGKGSTFAFAFPLEKSIALSPLIAGEPVPPRASPQPTVVVLGKPDSDETKLLQRHLQEYTLCTAADWAAAETLVAQQNARAVIVNGTMNEATGDLPASIQAGFPVPVIACPLPGPEQTARAMKIAHFVQKPVTAEAMGRALADVAPAARSVLIVDDEPSAVRLLERLIAAGGHNPKIFRAYGGREGWARLQAQRPDVAVLDLAMADGDGFWLLEKLRANPPWSEIPVIVVSGQAVETVWQSGPIGVVPPGAAGGFTPTETLNYLRALLSAAPPSPYS